MLLWFCAYNRLHTQQFRAHIGLAATGNCCLCSEGVEDSLHVLRDCCLAKDVWNNIIGSVDADKFYSGGMMDWIRRNTFPGKGNSDYSWDLHGCDLVYLGAQKIKKLFAQEDVTSHWVIREFKDV